MKDIIVDFNSQLTYRIEPFYFTMDLSKINSITGFKNYAFTKERFYEHINQLFFLEKEHPAYEHQIAKAFIIDKGMKNTLAYFDSLTENKITRNFLIEENKFTYRIKNNKDEQTETHLEFRLKDVQIIISEMQVGFLVYELANTRLFDKDLITGSEIEYKLTLENYETAMYYLRKMQTAKKDDLYRSIKNPDFIRYQKNKIAMKENNRKEPEKMISIPIKWTDLTAGLLHELGEIHSFTNADKVGHHALLYSSAFVETSATNQENKTKFEQSLAKSVYKISHGYRDTYDKEANVDDIVRPFDNVMWSMSAEGFSNLVYLEEHGENNKFFHDTFKARLKSNYYFMYVLALLQKYSFLYFTVQTGELLFQSSVYLGENLSKEAREQELERTRHFHAKTLKFTIHGYFEQVSYYSHYNTIFEQLIEALRIPHLQQELTPKIEAFSKVIETLVDEQNVKDKEEERKSQEKQNSIIQTISYFLLPASLAAGILGMNIPFIFNGENYYTVYTLLGVIFLTALLSYLLNKGKEISARTVMILSFLLLIGAIVFDVFY